MAPKCNYKWWAHGFGGGVCETAEPADGERVFSFFADARAALGDHFAALAIRYDDARAAARNLRKAGMQDGEVTL
jgi:hypothetical protein